jgi:hypothetical protein
VSEEITKYTELVTKTIERLAKVWESGEGEVVIRLTDDKGKRAKVSGGEVARIG